MDSNPHLHFSDFRANESSPPSSHNEFTGHHLPFVGFTYTQDSSLSDLSKMATGLGSIAGKLFITIFSHWMQIDPRWFTQLPTGVIMSHLEKSGARMMDQTFATDLK